MCDPETATAPGDPARSPRAAGSPEGGRSATSSDRRDADRPAARVDAYPPRLVTVDARLARLARIGPVLYEDFFFPPATWGDLDERTTARRAGGRGART